MKLNIFSENEADLLLPEGKRVLYSFGKPVAVFLPQPNRVPVVAYCDWYEKDSAYGVDHKSHIQNACRRWVARDGEEALWYQYDTVSRSQSEIEHLAR
jgi:hypothetical protein